MSYSVIDGLVVLLFACPSVKLLHSAKAVGRKEKPPGRDTRVVPINVVLDRGPDPRRKRRFEGLNPISQRCCISPNYFGIGRLVVVVLVAVVVVIDFIEH